MARDPNRPVSSSDPGQGRRQPPEPVAVVPQLGTAVRVPVEVGATIRAPVSDIGGVRLMLDGLDVTDRCSIRETMTHPRSQVDIRIRDADVGPGPHEAVVTWPEAAGPQSHRWSFVVE
jgi:hypothetical protein